MSETVLISLLSLCGTLLGSLAGILTSSRMTAYRLEQLEHKVEKHNQLVERMALAERDIQTLQNALKGKEDPCKTAYAPGRCGPA